MLQATLGTAVGCELTACLTDSNLGQQNEPHKLISSWNVILFKLFSYGRLQNWFSFEIFVWDEAHCAMINCRYYHIRSASILGKWGSFYTLFYQPFVSCCVTTNCPCLGTNQCHQLWRGNPQQKDMGGKERRGTSGHTFLQLSPAFFWRIDSYQTKTTNFKWPSLWKKRP